MIEINLLPWRQELREKKRRQGKIFSIILVFLPIIFFVAVHFGFGGYVENRTSQVKKLAEDQVHMVERDQSNQGDESAESVEEFDQERNDLLQRLVTLSQSGIGEFQLARMDYAQKKISVIGYVKSIANISQWVKENKLDIEVTQIKKIPDSTMLKFQAIIQ